jgi:hypothetical protein
MSAGQQLLVLGAIVLLSIFILRVYTTENSNIKNTVTNSAIIKATGIAQTLLEQIQTEAFDEKTVSKSVSTPDSLTLPSLLKIDAGETANKPTTFDDIDDYNGYTEIDTIGVTDIFNVKVNVSYCTSIKDPNPGSPSSVRTFSKRVDISVYNKYLNLIDTLKLSKVFSYY